MLAVNHMSHLAGVDKERLAFLFLAFCNKPQCNRDSNAVEKLCRHGDNAFNQIILNDLFADFTFAAGLCGKGSVGKHQTDFTIWCEMMNHMLNPCIVGVACRRHSVFPAHIIQKLFLIPRMIIERWIGKYKISFQGRVEVICKCIPMVWSKIGVYAANSHVHFRHFPCISVSLLSINRDCTTSSRMSLYKLCALNKHASRTATTIIHPTIIKGFENFYKCFNHAGWGVEFAASNTFFFRKLCNTILICTSKKIFAFFRVTHINIICENIHNVS